MIHLRRIVVTLLGTLGPFVLSPERLLHPAPWVLAVCALVMQLTLPRAGARELARSEADRGSGFLILLSGNLVVLVPVLEFVLRPKLFPSVFSAWVFSGALLMAGGVAFRVWSIRTLGAAFTGVVHTSSDQVLVKEGPYRVLRHPSYTGTLVAFLGEALMYASVAGAALTAAVLVPVYLYRIRQEERALEAHFGSAYARYRETSWAIVPGLY